MLIFLTALIAGIVGFALGWLLAPTPLADLSQTELALTRERVRTLWNENLIMRARLNPTKSNLLLAVETDPSLKPWADEIRAKQERDRIVSDYHIKLATHGL